jgi:type IV pilus assembly protein PilW
MHTMRTRNQGFTLLELMISIAIGLLLTLVIGTLFVQSRQTYLTTDDVSRMQENMRFAYQTLSRTVHLAGYRSSPNSDKRVIFAAPNQAISGTDSPGTTPDTLTVNFQGSSNGAGPADGSVVDCTGQEIPVGVLATNTFAIAAGADGNTALFCNGTELVPNVANMQVLYGEDSDDDFVADRYVPLASVGNLDLVVSVRIALLFQTPLILAGAGVQPDTNTYNMNGTVVGPFNDLRTRRLLVLNVNLRNRTP